MPQFPCYGFAVTCPRLLARDDILAGDRWSDPEADIIRLEATVTDNYIAGSDPTLQVRARDGVNWTIELAARARNREVGLTESRALPGDPVQIVGHTLPGFGENRIKALHLTIAGVDYDLSPEPLAAS